MRLNWMFDPNMGLSIGNIQDACQAFYNKYKKAPDTIKLTYSDYSKFNGQLYQTCVQTLERGKEYGVFILIPGGMAELTLLDDQDEAVANHMPGTSIMVIESTQLDREFEKHVLNKEE